MKYFKLKKSIEINFAKKKCKTLGHFGMWVVRMSHFWFLLLGLPLTFLLGFYVSLVVRRFDTLIATITITIATIIVLSTLSRWWEQYCKVNFYYSQACWNWMEVVVQHNTPHPSPDHSPPNLKCLGPLNFISLKYILSRIPN